MATILSIARALPQLKVTNADLGRENPSWAMGQVAKRSGIKARRVASEGETAFDLSVQACEELFARGDARVEDVDAILYCTHDPDYPMPGNSQLLHAHLDLGDDVLAFDYRLACSGFVYGLALADALARAGMASGILIVTAETTSRRMNRGDRATRALFGDGAAVTYLTSTEGDGGGKVVACELCTHGSGFEYGYIPAGGARWPPNAETRREETDLSGNVRTSEDLHLKGPELWGFVKSVVPGHVEAFLAKHGLRMEQIDLCVFHQASKLILDALGEALAIGPEKMFVHMSEVGNLSSASIPFALDAALASGAIEPGNRVLLCAYGTGISYGSAIVEF